MIASPAAAHSDSVWAPGGPAARPSSRRSSLSQVHWTCSRASRAAPHPSARAMTRLPLLREAHLKGKVAATGAGAKRLRDSRGRRGIIKQKKKGRWISPPALYSVNLRRCLDRFQVRSLGAARVGDDVE